jgi:alpha-N-arabinofuranosidase
MKKFGILIFLLLSINQLPAQSGSTNPVIPGFHPDPSVCRVGEDYYLVNSSFEFFPGVPVYHSRDLVHWTLIGHCLTRKSQLKLDRAWASGGIYAPTIRYNNGIFYMITTNVSHRGNFIVWTKDPAGEWSDPVWIEQGGIDPSLFFDDDGKVYYTGNNPGNGPEGIYQFEIDINTGKKLSPVKYIWTGTGGRYPEGPHLYKINGWYYLMIAEGGTEYGHMETIARGKSPWGPFESCPHNPILTHRGVRSQSNPIQGTGHADLVQDHKGNWWLVFLGFRMAGGQWHQLGRETFLSPVQWKDGWPMVGDSGIVHTRMNMATLPAVPAVPSPVRDEFNGPHLNLEWNYLRNPEMSNYSLTEKPGWLVLKGTSATLDSVASPSFIGRRQEEFNSEFTAKMDFIPSAAGCSAGITALMNNSYHYDLLAEKDASGKIIVRLYARLGLLKTIVQESPVQSGECFLRIETTPYTYKFSFSADGSTFTEIRQLDARLLSSEVAGGFTGVYLGLVVTGAGSAAFDWVKYENRK